MRNERSHGFTLIEILVVITIIAALTGGVMTSIVFAQERSRRLECANCLRQLGMLYTMERMDMGGLPRHSGAAYFLQFRSGEDCEIGVGQEELFVCPGDPTVIVPHSPDDRARYDEVDLTDVSEDLCAYVVRDFKRYPVAAEGLGLRAIAADRQGRDHRTHHHRGGVNVLFSDGSVKFMNRRALGIQAGEPIVVGPDASNEMLRKLVYASE